MEESSSSAAKRYRRAHMLRSLGVAVFQLRLGLDRPLWLFQSLSFQPIRVKSVKSMKPTGKGKNWL